tara:strand:+ start:658 stop:1071 length:414 start_codon:yes stop_codon:yes gene_type:complete
MEEMNVWNYLQAAGTTNAINFVGLAFLTWVGFRISSSVYNEGSTNMLVKISGTVFCLCVAWFWLFIWAIFEWNFNGVAGVFIAMQANGMEISQGAQYIVSQAAAPGSEVSLAPNLVQGLFLLSILVIQLGGLWMKKS